MNVKLVLYILGGMGLVSGAIMLISFNPLFDFILKKVISLLSTIEIIADVQRNFNVQWAATTFSKFNVSIFLSKQSLDNHKNSGVENLSSILYLS